MVDEISTKNVAKITLWTVNNLNESFNSYILPAREMPLISMFERIKRKMMQRIQVKRIGMERFQGTICPSIQQRLEHNKRLSRVYIPIWGGGEQFEVDSGNSTHVVDLSKWTCTYGLFQLSGIPCMHACASIQKLNKSVENFVHSCYNKANYLKVYAPMIHPVPSERYWVNCNEESLNPPTVRRMPSRPKKARRKGQDEPKKGQVSTRTGLTVHCS